MDEFTIKSLDEIREEFLKLQKEAVPEKAAVQQANAHSAPKVNRNYLSDIDITLNKNNPSDSSNTDLDSDSQDFPDTPMRSPRLVRVITDIVFILFVIAVLLYGAVFYLTENPDKSVFGYGICNISGESMSSAYETNDLVIVRIHDPVTVGEAVKNGDTIVYYPENEADGYTIGRVLDVIPDYNKTGYVAYSVTGNVEKPQDSVIIVQSLVIGIVQNKPLHIFGVAFNVIRQNMILSASIAVVLIILCIILRVAFSKRKTSKSVE